MGALPACCVLASVFVSLPTVPGDVPIVAARGGFSGLFPDSSSSAYAFAYIAGSPDTVSWCDVRLTKDGVGICLPEIIMDNCTYITYAFPDGKSSYVVNGVPTTGWFSVDYTMKDLSQVFLKQEVLSRTDKFDGNFHILSVEDVETQVKPPSFWLNIQHDMFYKQHNLSMTNYLISLSKRVIIDYVSSPEVTFLRGIAPRFRKSKTELVFRFLGQDIIEPSTNQTYGSLLKNLTFVKTFASGILVPKEYIWPVTSDLYLQPHTSLVSDAHKAELKVFASGFANDVVLSYNYSYDPLAEFFHFVDNGDFSVDGVLTDFPVTASEAIGCFSHANKNTSVNAKPVVVSHNGASGVYPGCTDLAYQQAVADGADIIDCPVQVTQDGVLICMSSINLMDDTTVTKSPFNIRSSSIPEIQKGLGIYTFNLTWDEIQKNLKPAMSDPELKYVLMRNPRFTNAGNFMTLSDFLAFGKRNKALAGVLISIEHASFLAEKLNYSITDAVMSALNQTDQEVLIQSSSSAVLMKMKQKTKCKLVYKVDESIGDADNSSITDIKHFADIVAVQKQSIYPQSLAFITGETELVKKLQSARLSVHVYLLRNEFVSQAWDFFSDPVVEINNFVKGAGVDGIITDNPGTAVAYKKNTCAKLSDEDAPGYMRPVQVGGLLQLIDPQAQPPALAPMQVLDVSDVIEPPLPPASLMPLNSTVVQNAVAPTTQPSAGQRCSAVSSFLVSVLMLIGYLMFV
ncbi:LOW QUALITY PROTEIN: glycerophosphodiester phosphodiesterase GDPDL4-like [Dioscorea cayenensis subsp. rotundata]|uniref:glycerophosphodiester phosphodiesterase n=1 Tax=Dioscorea cayennensis subsp. rotundata TaxID=55577 RepID=A0AB40CPZ2_DIOCR|nr:LOW QUALITY PROTEIN: glycerophosphodiester phosphodiesterase GDPDL4-like [Dioscorea cayenensis subsp. rotundata]